MCFNDKKRRKSIRKSEEEKGRRKEGRERKRRREKKWKETEWGGIRRLAALLSWLFSLPFSFPSFFLLFSLLSFIPFINSFTLSPLFFLRVIQWLLLCDTNKRNGVSWRGHKTYKHQRRDTLEKERECVFMNKSCCNCKWMEWKVVNEQMPSHVHWSLLLQFKGNILICKPREWQKEANVNDSVRESMKENQKRENSIQYNSFSLLFRFFSISHLLIFSLLSISRLFCHSTQNEEGRGEKRELKGWKEIQEKIELTRDIAVAVDPNNKTSNLVCIQSNNKQDYLEWSYRTWLSLSLSNKRDWRRGRRGGYDEAICLPWNSFPCCCEQCSFGQVRKRNPTSFLYTTRVIQWMEN